MSDYFDEDGESLGDWKSITEAEFEAIKNDGSVDWQVFATRTEVGDRTISGWRGRIIYTEWGICGAAHPLVRCDDRWDSFGERTHMHGLFVPVGAL